MVNNWSITKVYYQTVLVLKYNIFEKMDPLNIKNHQNIIFCFEMSKIAACNNCIYFFVQIMVFKKQWDFYFL